MYVHIYIYIYTYTYVYTHHLPPRLPQRVQKFPWSQAFLVAPRCPEGCHGLPCVAQLAVQLGDLRGASGPRRPWEPWELWTDQIA